MPSQKIKQDKVILFDIDGTLLLTGGAGKMAFDQVFDELFGIQEAWQDVHPDGRTDPSLVEELFQKNFGRSFGQEEYQKVVDLYQKTMAKTLWQAPRFRLMPGVQALLEHLVDTHECQLGLATGNFEEAAWLKLERAGLRRFFSYGGFGSDHGERLELTRLAHQRGADLLKLDSQKLQQSYTGVLIGDTVHDITCAQALGMKCLAVATGSTAKEDLAAAEVVLDDLEDLDKVMECLFA